MYVLFVCVFPSVCACGVMVLYKSFPNTLVQEIFGRLSIKILLPLENSFTVAISVSPARYTEYCIQTVELDVAGNSGMSGTL